jgi:hypothetical protein
MELLKVSSDVTPASNVCFVTGIARPKTLGRVEHRLGDSAALALAELLQVLCCGEESAVFAFQRLSGKACLQEFSRRELLRIASEEEVHEVLLSGLRASLPNIEVDAGLQRRLRRFFISLESREMGVHFARLAALDSGVCAVLGELQRPQAILKDREHGILRIFRKIHQDEANHVRTALTLGIEMLERKRLEDEIMQTRERLSQLLMSKSSAFETLGVDSDRLKAKLNRCPRLS